MVQLGKSVKYYDDCEVIRYRERFIGKATIIIKEFRTDEKSVALYAWGIAICGPRETFDENEGVKRANGRADWVIERYKRRKYDFSDYQKRYSYKHNRKLLKENQLSLSEKDQFSSLDEIVDLAAFFDKADFGDKPIDAVAGITRYDDKKAMKPRKKSLSQEDVEVILDGKMSDEDDDDYNRL